MEESFKYFAYISGSIIGGLIILFLIIGFRDAIFNIICFIISGAMMSGGYAMLTQVGGGVGTLGIFLILLGVGFAAAIIHKIKHGGFNNPY